MNKLSFLLCSSLAFALAVCQLLSLYQGDLGLKNYRQLLATYNNLQLNVENLGRTNSNLSSRKEALETDKESLILAMRKVGYYQTGEKRIIIEGLSRIDREPFIGHVIRLDKQKPSTSLPLVPIFFSVWLGSLMLLLLFFTFKPINLTN